MVRYKRYRRRGRRSTNVIKMKFQSFMDISTNASSMQIITISAGGKELLRRLAPQFSAYKYFKIGNISVKLVPASTLPVDPTGLSITVGDNLVDPRDQLTPGMMRITNGEDVFEDLTGLSDDQQYGIYNNMLLDPRWFKWMLQSGVKRHATPRYWQIGQLHQDKWPGAVTNYPLFNAGDTALVGTYKESIRGVQGSDPAVSTAAGSSPYGFFQTGHRGVIGWMPTDAYAFTGINGSGGEIHQPLVASPMEIEVMKILLPKAHKTRYWYRMFVTETVYFREPIVNFGIPSDDTYCYRPLDVFRTPSVPVPTLPVTGLLPWSDSTIDSDSGGNDGSD